MSTSASRRQGSAPRTAADVTSSNAASGCNPSTGRNARNRNEGGRTREGRVFRVGEGRSPHFQGTYARNIANVLCMQADERTTDLDTRHSEFWGDPLPDVTVSDENRFRVFSQNINGFAPRLGTQKIAQVCASLHKIQASVIGLQETNLNWHHAAVKKNFSRTLKQTWPHVKQAVASTQLPWEAMEQQGGSCVWAVDQWAHRVTDSFTDEPLGRWTGLTLQGTKDRKITIISAYRVCQGQCNLDRPATAVAQQGILLRELGLPCDPRTQFLTDLSKTIKKLISERHEIILLLDANDHMATAEEPPTSFNCFLEDLELVDVLTHQHRLSGPATHQRGSRRIDFIVVTPALLPACRSSGICPMAMGHDSDHRAIYVDFDAENLFRGMTGVIPATPRRQLLISNPKALLSYIDTLRRAFIEHKFVDKIKQLTRAFEQHGVTQELIHEYEKIDQSVTNHMLNAERKCTRPRRSGHAWSPQLRLAAYGVRYWALRLRQLKSRCDFKSQLKSVAKAAGIEEADQDQEMTGAQIQQRLSTAVISLRESQHQATKLRDDFLQSRAEFWADRLPGGDEEKILQSLRTRETQTRHFTQLRQCFKEDTSRGLDYIDTGVDSGSPERLFDRQRVHQCILDNNRQRFEQTASTPFSSFSKLTHLGLDGAGKGTTDILRGRYRFERSGLSGAAKLWISLLRYHKSVAAGEMIDTSIEAEDFVSAWLKYRESTSSSPSGRHYGHYKAAALAHNTPERLQHDAPNPLYFPGLATYHAAMTSIPVKFGFAPARWKRSINAMLEKSNKSRVVDKLRIIHLFEADFNFVLKLVWGRRLIRHAETQGWLGQDQHGSRPGRQAVDGILEKRLLYDFARLSKTSLVTIDNDAKACYDRIIKTTAMIACMGVGLPRAAAAMHNETHYKMVHQVKTAHGISTGSYTGSLTRPLEGTGQGSGASPAIWLIVSSTLLRALNRVTPGMMVTHPDKNAVKVGAVFYVDDGMPGVGDAQDKEAAPWKSLADQASVTASKWEQLLHTSGGALELTKCFCQVIYWTWSQGRARLAQPIELHEQIQVQESGSDTPRVLQVRKPEEGQRTLGVRIAPSGSDKSEVAFRITQGQAVAKALLSANMSRTVAFLGYRSIICPKMEYPLPVTCFSKKEAAKIMATYFPVVLRKMGLPRNFPRGIAFSPVSQGGMGLHHLYIEQGVRKAALFVGHLRQKGRTGDLLRTTVAWAQLSAGVSMPIMEQPSVSIPWLEPTWAVSLREFLAEHQLAIRIIDPPGVRHQPRIHDRSLMELFAGVYKRHQLLQLNRCRLYMKVEWLSEVCSGDGTKILESALSCCRTGSFRSTRQWPRQPRPSLLARRLWRQALEKCLLASSRSYSLRTDFRLGPWSLVQHKEWVHTFDITTQRLYSRLPDGTYRRYKQTQVVCGDVWCSLEGGQENLHHHAGLVPATIHQTHKGVGVSHGTYTPIVSPGAIPGETQLQRHIRRHYPWGVYLLQEVGLIRPELLSEPDNKYIFDMACDAGVAESRGAYAWVLYNNNRLVAQGSGEVEGYPRFQSSTRAELYGINSGLFFLLSLQRFYHWRADTASAPAVRITCDNQGAIRILQRAVTTDWFRVTSRTRVNADLEAVARWILRRLVLSVTFEWIKGHQKPTKNNPTIPYLGRLNNIADAQAGHRLSEVIQSGSSPSHQLLPPMKCVLWHATAGTITGDITRETRDIITAPLAEEYFCRRYQWTRGVWGEINIDAYATAVKAYNINDRLRIVKLRTGWLPINRRAKHYIAERTERCPACSGIEDVDHLFHCEGQRRRTVWLISVTKSLRKIKTGPEVLSALMHGITQWSSGEATPSPPAGCSDDIVTAWGQQDRIGWGLLCRGFLARGWSTPQIREQEDTRGRDWEAKCHRAFFDAFLLLWQARNEAVHGSSVSQEAQRRLQLRRQIEDMYERATRILPCDRRWIFPLSLDSLCGRPRKTQRQWLRMATRAMVGAEERRNNLPAGQRLITGFLPLRSGLADDPP